MVIEFERPGESQVMWSRVEEGFHVGSREGEFLGYIERQADGRYLACDLYSRPVDRFPDLPSAMRAVESVRPTDGGPA